MDQVSWYEISKLLIEGLSGVFIVGGVLVGLGIHRRKHQELDSLSKEHKSRQTSCPFVLEVKQTLREMDAKQDHVISKVDRILGHLQGPNGKSDG